MMRTWSRLLELGRFWGVDHFPRPRLKSLTISRERSTAAGIWGLVMLTAFGGLICATAIVAQFRTLKTQIAGLKTELAGMQRKLAKLEAGAVATPPDRTEITGGLAAPLLKLNRDEIQTIRDFIKVVPPPLGATPKIKLGDILPDFALSSVPEPIMDKLPKLKGARFTVDQNRATVIVAPGSNRVDVIINPK